jgi:diacylglycerol kinase (ATP)
VYNPNSRNGKSKKILEKFLDLLKSDKKDFFYINENNKESAFNKMKEGLDQGYKSIIAVGGDGTVHHAANFAIQNQIPLGIIPSGSGNDFASAIGLSGNVNQAYQTLLEENIVKINSIETKTDTETFYTINVAGAGVDAKVAKAAQERFRWIPGNIKYDLSATIEIFKDKPTKCRYSLDGVVEEKEIRLFIAGLGQTAGSGMIFNPDVRFTHDKMQGGIINGNVSRFTLVRALQKVRKAKHVNLPYVNMFNAREIWVETVDNTESLMVESEGELRGNTRLEMKVVDEVLPVFVPKDFSLDDKSPKRGKY